MTNLFGEEPPSRFVRPQVLIGALCAIGGMMDEVVDRSRRVLLVPRT
ncbi:MAG: hypothetical protein U1E63_02095 [Burkholderiales bacterium]